MAYSIGQKGALISQYNTHGTLIALMNVMMTATMKEEKGGN
jgi:hypothetical protein